MATTLRSTHSTVHFRTYSKKNPSQNIKNNNIKVMKLECLYGAENLMLNRKKVIEDIQKKEK